MLSAWRSIRARKGERGTERGGGRRKRKDEEVEPGEEPTRSEQDSRCACRARPRARSSRSDASAAAPSGAATAKQHLEPDLSLAPLLLASLSLLPPVEVSAPIEHEKPPLDSSLRRFAAQVRRREREREEREGERGKSTEPPPLLPRLEQSIDEGCSTCVRRRGKGRVSEAQREAAGRRRGAPMTCGRKGGSVLRLGGPRSRGTVRTSLFSSAASNAYSGTSRLSGAGPRRARPEICGRRRG